MQNSDPAYNRLLAYLRNEIHGLQSGARLPSYRRLIRQFACSQATVDRVLDVLAGEGLVERRPASGVYVTGSPRQRGDTVLFMVPDISIRNCALIVGGGEKVARQQGYRAEVFNYRDALKPLPEGVIAACRAMALVLRSTDIDTGAARAFLQSLPPDLPVVLVETDVPGMEYPFFGFRDFDAGRTAAREFRARGLQRIGCVGSALSHISQTRLTGFAQELGRYPDLMIDFAVDEYLNREAVTQLKTQRLDGLFISRPDIALQTLCYLEAIGVRVPQDLFVVTIAEDGDGAAYPCDVVSLVKPSAKASRDALRALLAGLKTRKLMPYRRDVPAALGKNTL